MTACCEAAEVDMITGAHSIIYSTDADADRAFLRDVLGLRGVDVGGGWLIFGLPPAELAVHPAEGGSHHELYLMCDDVAAFVAAMQAKGVACSPVNDLRWGLLTEVTLPGGGKLGVYQPRHARPQPAPAARPPARRPARGGKPRKRTPKRKARAPRARRR
jgi:catechol 2,3-dioxygenase-like lactoylglutathione lyase family enzyme